jgi:nucleotide-binding universal stress UspA family protein
VQVAASEDTIDPALAYLDAVREQIAARYPGVRVATSVHLGVDVADEILRLLAETRPDMVVMATHGRTGLRRALIGSVAAHVLRHGTAPLVLVRPTTPEEQSGESHESATALPVSR